MTSSKDREGKKSSLVQYDESTIIDPPSSLIGRLKFLGPSFAIVAATIGSGELIATTAAGAQVGIVGLWVLVLSIILKSGVQYILAKYPLITGKTPHAFLDEVPGTIYGHSWVWWWMVIFWVAAEPV
jgi:manganese transport protein